MQQYHLITSWARISLRIQVKFSPTHPRRQSVSTELGWLRKVNVSVLWTNHRSDRTILKGIYMRLRTTFVSKFPLNALHRIFTYASNSFDRAGVNRSRMNVATNTWAATPIPTPKCKEEEFRSRINLCEIVQQMFYWLYFSTLFFSVFFFGGGVCTGQIDISSWWCVLSW